ncbi:hypothetical protein BB561_005476 [Smittium simulii]|uniref:Uncharacterized protein n=1 Tax=Smittium simulii TaxID=133385 RepID=A0A2T9YA82_9FUNG|nr:hypothetical protein BB561_005476 [Smittium simulii]
MINQKFPEIPSSSNFIFSNKTGAKDSTNTNGSFDINSVSKLPHKKSLEHPLKRKSLYSSTAESPLKKTSANNIFSQKHNISQYGTIEYPTPQSSLFFNHLQTVGSMASLNPPQPFHNSLSEPLSAFGDPWNNRDVNIASHAIADSEIFEEDDFGVFNPHWEEMLTFLLSWVSVPLPAIKFESNTGSPTFKIHFWSFLLFYYGIYNLCALLLVTNMFRLYSLNWWPESMSATSAIITSWIGSMSLGAIFYEYDPQLLREPLVWTGITLATLILPLIISFLQTRKHYSQLPTRPIYATTTDHMLFFSSLEWRTPTSYLRFLWFCGIFTLWYLALVAGEYLAYTYVSTLPHKSIENLKNLFARLHSPDQYLFIQLGSSLWVVLFFPFRMSKITWKILSYFDLAADTYEEYLRHTGFTFYIRNLAENTTMLAFLSWVSILHYGPNKALYPYFQFSINDSDNSIVGNNHEVRYSYELTMKASIVVWCCEFTVSRMEISVYDSSDIFPSYSRTAKYAVCTD